MLVRLLEIAGETYNDPEGFQNPNKYHFGVADFKRVGFELVAHIFNAEHDTHCFVLQDRPKAVRELVPLVVAPFGSTVLSSANPPINQYLLIPIKTY